MPREKEIGRLDVTVQKEELVMAVCESANCLCCYTENASLRKLLLRCLAGSDSLRQIATIAQLHDYAQCVVSGAQSTVFVFNNMWML